MPSTAFCDDFSGQASKWSYSALSVDGSQWVDQKYRQVSEFAMEKLMLLGRTTISGRAPGYPELFLKTPLHPTLTPKAEARLTPTVRAEPGAQAQSAHIGTQHVLSEGADPETPKCLLQSWQLPDTGLEGVETLAQGRSARSQPRLIQSPRCMYRRGEQDRG